MSELYLLPSGFGHMAPKICLEQFQSAIQEFIDGLGTLGDAVPVH